MNFEQRFLDTFAGLGVENPFGDADFAAAWSMRTVKDDEWRERRAALERELRAWQTAIAQPREWEPVTLGGALGSVVHLAYHLGAIRQLSTWPLARRRRTDRATALPVTMYG